MIEHQFVDPHSQQHYTLTKHDTFTSISFFAMANRCELLLDTKDIFVVHTLAKMCLGELKRIVDKFSRYVPGNTCHKINSSHGKPVDVDNECIHLLLQGDFCFKQSNGLMDLTTGILRRIWYFDGGDQIPSQSQIDTLLPLIGWEKVRFSKTSITLPDKMELDFGSIAKEYAVECISKLAFKYIADVSVVVNLGGDIQITKPRNDGSPWFIGIECTDEVIALSDGALSTSTTNKRFLMKNGQYFSHLLNPKTGWPISDPPQSVSVHTPSCTVSGMLATTASLNGTNAIRFLEGQNVQYWIKA